MILLDDNKDGIAISGEQDTLPKYIIGQPPAIEWLRRRQEEVRGDPYQRRNKNQRNRAYYNGPGQLDWPVAGGKTPREMLRQRGQPQIYTNRIRPAINGILGVLESSRSDPQAYPRNPDDQDSADVATKVLRFVADQCKLEDTLMDVAENYFIEGEGAVITEMVDDDIWVTQIRWEEFYCDSYSRRNDRSDARFMGTAKWKDVDAITSEPRWADRILEAGNPLTPSSSGTFSDTYDDRGDNGTGWINTRRRRVMLCEEYAIIENEWKRIVYIGNCVLEYGPSPYVDDKGRPCNPIDAAACYVDENNGSYGPIDDMVPIQDEVNASRSRSLHLMNSRQIQQTDPSAPPVDSMLARQEASKADGVIPAGWQMVPTNDMTQANILRNQEAKGEIERMGPTPAVLGRQEGAGQSGRARLVSQQAGLTELSRPLSRLDNLKMRVYQQIWNRARQFKTDEWFIRITDDVRAPEFLKVNEVVGQQIVQQPVMDPQTGQPVVDPMTGQPAMQMAVQPVMKNRLAEMDVDIILDTVSDTATLAQEVWAELVQLVGQAGGMQAVYTPAFELMIEASPLADKSRVIELIKKGRQEQETNQVQQLTQQVQQLTQALQAKQETTAEETASTIAKNNAAAHKSAVEADTGRAELFAGLGIDPILALNPEFDETPQQQQMEPGPEMMPEQMEIGNDPNP